MYIHGNTVCVCVWSGCIGKWLLISVNQCGVYVHGGVGMHTFTGYTDDICLLDCLRNAIYQYRAPGVFPDYLQAYSSRHFW